MSEDLTPIAYASIVFADNSSDRATPSKDPSCFKDLNLDQVVTAVLAAKAEYDLGGLYRQPLRTPGEIVYRQSVFRDLENHALIDGTRTFADSMTGIRRRRSQLDQMDNQHQRNASILETANRYCGAVCRFSELLSATNLQAEALGLFRDYLTAYVGSEEFVSLKRDGQMIASELATIRYLLSIRGGRVDVSRYESQPDYAVEVGELFARFDQGDRLQMDFGRYESAGMNHVELWILDRVAKLHPEVFQRLTIFAEQRKEFVDAGVARFDREIQFYVSYIDYTDKLKTRRLPFCIPEISTAKNGVFGRSAFDLALAAKLAADDHKPVPNDFELSGQERVCVVSGPNQGGKTTFARLIGQMHYLGALGCPVPGSSSRVQLFDGIYTHFERIEQLQDLRGKLEDDLVRIKSIFDQATGDSLILINEIFSSTSLEDAVLLSDCIARRIAGLDAYCVWVTFVDEVSRAEKAVSYVSTVDAADPAVRTFKIEKKPADGRAYAIFVAEKHGLTYEKLVARISG